MDNAVLIDSVYKAVKPTVQGQKYLERKLKQCIEKYGDKLYRTVTNKKEML